MQITRGRKRPRESGALAQSGVQSRNWELRECRIGEIMRDCISLMMTFISLDIFFAMLSTPTAFFCLASAFGPSRYDSRVPRDPQRGGNGSRGRCRETAPGRAVHSPPPLLDERVLSRRRRQLPGGNLATFENNSTSLASAWTALIRPTDSAEPWTCCWSSSPTSATLATLSPPVAPALFF